jgi:ABC-type branched-subunit amino acid transport system substrate-binding protein
MIRYLVDHKRYKRIGILYQDDSFGRAGLEGVVRALNKRNLQLVSEETYKRNTVAVKRAVLEIKGADADAVVLVGTYQPLAAYIRLCRELGLKPEFMALSFVGSEALADELGKDGAGVLITQVVPFPFDGDRKIIQSYKNAIKSFNSNLLPGYTSFEGYIVGRLIGKTLSDISPTITREGFIDSIVSQKEITIDDLTLTYGAKDNQGLDQVYTTIIGRDGKIRPYQYGIGGQDGHH